MLHSWLLDHAISRRLTQYHCSLICNHTSYIFHFSWQKRFCLAYIGYWIYIIYIYVGCWIYTYILDAETIIYWCRARLEKIYIRYLRDISAVSGHNGGPIEMIHQTLRYDSGVMDRGVSWRGGGMRRIWRYNVR